MRISRSEILKSKKVLIIDSDLKINNDRTWCFWEKEKNYFENLLHKEWKQAEFIDEFGKIDLTLHPYSYKMIRGIDFYEYCIRELKNNANVTFLHSEVLEIKKMKSPQVITSSGTFHGDLIFDSTKPIFKENKNYHTLWQHFKGIIVETEEDCFNDDKATLMDFTIDQQGDCRFFYVLPINQRKALIEYTIFNESVFNSQSEYDKELMPYIHDKLKNRKFTLKEKEIGVIPMSNAPVSETNFKEHIKIGTAGGLTKASSGYTFKFIQNDSERILKQIENGIIPDQFKAKGKFMLYDAVLLHILKNKKMKASQVFSDLFRKNNCVDVFTFLNNESSLTQDLMIMSSVKKSVFIPAAFVEIFRNI